MGKQWSNPPVFYTLAQVKFNHIAQMEEYIPKLQDQLRKSGYPDYKPEQAVEVAINRPGSSQPDVRSQRLLKWSFTNAERTEGYVLQNDSLVYHSTKYEVFEDFLKKTIKGLELTDEVIGLAYVERIGLRYLDAVVPNEEVSIEAYLTPSLLGLSVEVEGGLKHSFSETAAQIDGGMLVTRSVIVENGLAIPPDLFPMQLTMPEKKAGDFTGRAAVIDTDYFVERRSNFDLADVEIQLIASHEIVSDVFKKAITEHAVKMWE